VMIVQSAAFSASKERIPGLEDGQHSNAA